MGFSQWTKKQKHKSNKQITLTDIILFPERRLSDCKPKQHFIRFVKADYYYRSDHFG